jgi:glycosyltransferase involved in cell wall biosynthesis
MQRPKFSIIAVDYEKHVPRDGFRKGIESLANQTFKDFELIICHDGPKEVPYSDEIDFKALGLNPTIIHTSHHLGEWGHPSRDLAMRQANGEFFIQFNIDNVFYPEAFEKINNKLNETNVGIVIFQVLHFKMNGGVVPFTGIPPVVTHIDAMQLVAHRDIWKESGYWYRNDFCADGYIYQEMCSKHPWAELPEVLGDNY